MGTEVELFRSDSEELDDIVEEVDSGYSVLLNQIKESGEEEALYRSIEELIHMSIQQQAANRGEIHKAYAVLITEMVETGEIDLQSVVENAIHSTHQQI